MCNLIFRNPGIPFSMRRKFQIQLEYRSHQILNKLAQDVSTAIVAGGYLIGSGILITSSYCLIRYHSVIDPLFLLVLIVLALLVTLVIVLLVIRAINIREQSEQVYLGFQDLVPCSKSDSKFWKSCRPIKMKVGFVGSIESHEYLIILFEAVVIRTTINLLLNF